MAGRRLRAVREAKRDIDRHCEHRRSVVAMVGHDHGDVRGAIARDIVERRRERQVGMSDDDALQALAAYPLTAGVGRAVERSGIVDRRDAACRRPRDDFRRAGHDHCGPWRRRRDNAIRHRSRQGEPFIVVEDRRKTRLAMCERPQRNDDTGGHRDER